MSSVVVEVDQYDATVTVPDDGDAKNAASVTAVGVGFQPLSNRTGFLQTRRQLTYPSSAAPNSGSGRVATGTPPTVANIETLTCPAGLLVFSGTLTLPLSNLVTGDILHITGSLADVNTLVGPPLAVVVGDATNLTIFDGWMFDTSGGATTTAISFHLTHEVTALEAAGFTCAVGLRGANATAANIDGPASFTVMAYRQ